MSQLIVKVRAGGKGLTVFTSRAVRNGAVQKAFAEQIGKPVGGCVRAAVHSGMSIGAIHDAVKDCAKQAPNHLNLGRARVEAAGRY